MRFRQKPFFKFIYLHLVALTFISSSITFAEEAKKPEESRTWEEIFIKGDLYMSKFFNGVAEKIDLFLSRKDSSEIRNTTAVRIENISSSVEGKPVTNLVHLNVNLRLPNLEEYWQLKFTTYDENEESRGIQKGYLRQTPRDQNVGASVGLFKKLGKLRTAFQPRIELQDPLRVSHSLKFDSVADMKTYEINPKLEFFATPDKGTGVFGAVNFNYHISTYYSLNIINEGEYQEKLNLFSSDSGLSLSQKVSDNSSLAYNVFFNSNSRPHYHLDSYNFSIGWNHVIYKKILDYQIVPHLDFPLSNSFKGIAGLVLVVGLNF